MRIVQGMLIFGFIVFLAALVLATVNGNFWQEVGLVVALPWGKLMLLDLYFGFSAFSLIIIFLEKSISKSIVWVALLFMLGNIVAIAYLILRLKHIKTLVAGEIT